MNPAENPPPPIGLTADSLEPWRGAGDYQVADGVSSGFEYLMTLLGTVLAFLLFIAVLVQVSKASTVSLRSNRPATIEQTPDIAGEER